MNCRVCGMDCLTPLWEDLPRHRGIWHHCWGCGSDCNETEYEQIKKTYNEPYLDHNAEKLGFEGCVHEMNVNVHYFERHRVGCPDNTFIDIGCLEGAGMAAMAKMGWSVHGFDVIPESKKKSPPGDHVTVAPEFKASLFPRTYSAVMAREVVEHVPYWDWFLNECFEATSKGGLFQIQTPRPNPDCIGYVYFADHLQIFSPFTLREALEDVGFKIIDSKLWHEGQLWLCRK